jgi:hypothetical protein
MNFEIGPFFAASPALEGDGELVFFGFVLMERAVKGAPDESATQKANVPNSLKILSPFRRTPFFAGYPFERHYRICNYLVLRLII